MKNDFVLNDLLKRKSYLLKENYCPNININFDYLSEDLKKIIKSSNVYRYDIYKYLKDEKVISFGGGNPLKWKQYEFVKKDIDYYLKENNTNQYPNTIGDSKVKKNLIGYLNSIGIKSRNEEEIIITSSTTQAYSLILKTVLRKNDVILIPVPTYNLFLYEPLKLGSNIELVKFDQNLNWKINLENLEKQIIDINKKLFLIHKKDEYILKVAAIYFQNPNNPLGISYSYKDKKYLHELAKLCYKQKVLIIEDLIYRDSVYDSEYSSFSLNSFDEYKDNVISFFGISKSYSLASLRAGFIVANKYFIQDIRDNIFLDQDSVSMLSQIALASVFTDNYMKANYRKKYLVDINKQYELNLSILKYFILGALTIPNKDRKIIENNLTIDEIKYYKKGNNILSFYNGIIPISGFFALIDFSKLKSKKINENIIKSDNDLLIELFKHSKIKFIPGTACGVLDAEKIVGRITFSSYYLELIDKMKILMNVIIELMEL